MIGIYTWGALAKRYWKQIGAVVLLLAVWGWHKAEVRKAYKAGYSAAVAAQIEASAKDKANAEKAVNLQAFVKCHQRQNAGEKVIWDREEQKCEKLP